MFENDVEGAMDGVLEMANKPRKLMTIRRQNQLRYIGEILFTRDNGRKESKRKTEKEAQGWN